ncbi:MAG TPA: hypothetical protein VGN18_06400 [Jatrophihabitans sp.]|jgi:hypothetical protein|uniref:hypothetical protein n=1 Tax=Jatrophihabitans sp. TaxID=1932789 RepID=UPI002E0A73EF|nr:hypothetical protein [Jatrophihabitans sp.]
MTRVLSAVIAAALLLPACSSSPPSSPRTVTVTATQTVTVAPSSAPDSASSSAPASATPDACSLLTRTEAEKLAGTRLDAPVGAGPHGTQTLCQFTGPTTGPTAQVEVLVGDGVQSALAIDKDNLKHRFVTVAGIGDQCLAEDDNIFFEKGGVWVQINLVLLNDPAQNTQPLRTAARAIVARLP